VRELREAGRGGITLLNWFEQHLVISTVTTVAGLLVVVPLLISKRTHRWAQRMLDSDIEAIGAVVLVLAIIAIALYNRLS
jgi:hypothetical protein